MWNTCAEFIGSGVLIKRFIHRVLPLVNKEVDAWKNFAKQHMQGELQHQALSSIKTKKFHCQGGCFYSIYPAVRTEEFIRFTVALQTISDYLDNLCDRAGILDEAAFRQLHYAMTDALDPVAPHHEYYAYYPFRQDGGYLDQLVSTCQEILHRLPAYHCIRQPLLYFASLYSSLQTYKHIRLEIRESHMLRWLKTENTIPELSPWEFAAATGSTLGMFMLVAAAYHPELTAADALAIRQAYFPWISGLHIQLDYLIDQAEDAANDDLNFIFYYNTPQEACQRLQLFYRQALLHAGQTNSPIFAKTIVRGLLALYLSDTKTKAPDIAQTKSGLLSHADASTMLLYHLCRLLRRKKVISGSL